MESCVPQVLEEMLFLLLELLVHLIVFFFLKEIAYADLIIQSPLLKGKYICLILYLLMLSDNYVQNILKKMGCLESTSSLEESYFEVFFLNSCKQKERDIHGHLSIHLEIYTEYIQCGVYLLIQIHTNRVSTLTPSHIPTPLHTACEYKCECPREFTGVCILPNDEIPDLYYS